MSVRRSRRGGVRIRLAPAEVAVLRQLPDELAHTYDAGEDDVARRRLFPTAYLDPTEEASEANWRELVHPGLREGRLAALEVVRSGLAGLPAEPRRDVALELDATETQVWLGVVNDARLALGTRLGVTDDALPGADDEHEHDRDDPDVPARAVYAWLTALEGELVDALLSDLGESGSDD